MNESHSHNRRCTRGWDLQEKIEHFVPVRNPGECWIWTGALVRGYGVIQLDGKLKKAHRISYEVYVGPIPEGLTIDHVRSRGCTSRACVNPAHLEPVTGPENSRRRSTGICREGHPLDKRVRSTGRRYCSICHRENARKRRNRARARLDAGDDE